MSKAIKLSKDMIGNKVRCINKINCHHPEVGTIGTIVKYDEHDTDSSYKVQWPKGSTMYGDRWWAINKCIELVEDDETSKQKIPDMTNEEIWEMLKPKIEKNEIKPCSHHYMFGAVYNKNDVINAIAIAYRSGYLRAMKGRPFKIGEKKKKCGHWVPVDPNNLPKEGTKVRYARECKEVYHFHEIKLNDEGTVHYHGDWFGFNSNTWHCFDNAASSLDMWVEDDE